MKDIFFDLDHTLWDFDGNAEETLRELYILNNLEVESGKSVEHFLTIYKRINAELWALYRKSEIEKAVLRTKRFTDTFLEMGMNEAKIPTDIWEQYLNICPTKTKMVPGAIELLDYLSDKYQLHLMTTGFAETQRRKLKHADLNKYFSSLTISEEVGVQKPNPIIFRQALQNAGLSDLTGIYIGDNYEADIKGGLSSGWTTYWYNPKGKAAEDHIINDPNYNEISDLLELKKFF